MTHSTEDYFDYPRGRVIIVYTASTVFFTFSIGYYALLFTVPALICGLILSLTSTYRDLRGLIPGRHRRIVMRLSVSFTVWCRFYQQPPKQGVVIGGTLFFDCRSFKSAQSSWGRRYSGTCLIFLPLYFSFDRNFRNYRLNI